MTKQIKIKTIAERNDWRVRLNYSGRGMYGKTCLAVIGESPEDIIATVGIQGAKIDNMGLDYIVYWPNISNDSND
jgi:hypothetical protein